MKNFTKCSATDCQYGSTCARKQIIKPDLSWCNFQIMGCDLDSGFDCFIPILNEESEDING
jgi:hypothetical protein